MKVLLKNFINMLKRYKTSSILNILGLAAAFATLYLILVQVSFDLNYNKNIKDHERVFAIFIPSWDDNTKLSSWGNRPTIEQGCADIPFVEHLGLGNGKGKLSTYLLEKNNSLTNLNSINDSRITLPFIDILGVEFIEGDAAQMIDTKNISISESCSKRFNIQVGDILYFGDNKNPNYPQVVTGIYKDLPKGTDFTGIDLLYNIGDNYINSQSEWSFNYFIKLSSADKKEELEQMYLANIEKVLRNELNTSEEDVSKTLERIKIKLIPISKTYFAPNIESSFGEQGSKKTTYTLLIIAILILLIALINFINFFFALVPVRIKSVNTYKIFGSSQTSLRFTFIFEALGIIFISLILASIIIYFIQGSHIVNFLTAPTAYTSNIFIVIITLAIAFFIGIIASIYPAYYITSFPAAFVIKGGFAASKSGKLLRNLLIGLQFTISIGLIMSTLIINNQHSFMMNYNMGFDKELLINGFVPPQLVNTYQKRLAFENKVKEDPQIKDIAWGDGKLVAKGRMGWGREFKGKYISLQVYPVSWNFLQVMGIEMEEGRYFTEADELKENGTFIFNKKAQGEYDIALTDLVSGHNGPTEVAGICKNFNYAPLQYGVDPFTFYVFGAKGWRQPSGMFVRLHKNTDIKKVIANIKSCIQEMHPNVNINNIEFTPFDKVLSKQYEREEKLATLIGLFTLLSIIISLMGVFGLVLFETQYKLKEIGVRRVHGASIGNILWIFNYKFVKIIIICFLIATPITYYAMSIWLNTFAYHTQIHWWVFALSITTVIIITLTIVTLRSLSAAIENPVKSIKTNE